MIGFTTIKLFFWGVILSCLVMGPGVATAGDLKQAVPIGMNKEEFFKIYPKKNAWTYRTVGPDDWFTYVREHKRSDDFLTFYFKNGILNKQLINDRSEVVEEYLGEFCSPTFIYNHPKIHKAIRDALLAIPQNAFLKVTDRERPMLFTEVYTRGLSRFANTSEIISGDNDAPAFQHGMGIMKLATELEESNSSEAIEGIILHEFAHRVLDHALKPTQTCEMEREANRLVKTWGYQKQYLAAKERFGGKERSGDEKCPPDQAH